MTNWNLILDRQVTSNSYGYEFNGQRGIQDEELIPDPNENKEIDVSETSDVLKFILEKSLYPYQVHDAIKGFESDELEKYIDAHIVFIRQKELALEVINQISLKLEQYSEISSDQNVSEIERSQLAAEIARLGYQPDLNNGKIYLADNTIIKGKVTDWAGELAGVNRSIKLELTEDYKVSNDFGYFFMPKGTNIYIDLDRAKIVLIPDLDKLEPEFYDLEGEKVGFVDFKDAFFYRYEVIFQEDLDKEQSGISFYNISIRGISNSDSYSYIEAERVRIFNQDIHNATVFFYEGFNVLSVSSSRGFLYQIGNTEVRLERIGFYPNGQISSINTKQTISIPWINGESISLPEGTRVYYYPNGNIKSIRAAFRRSFKLDLDIFDNSLTGATVDEILLSDTGDIQRVEFVNRELMTLPVLGAVYVRKIDNNELNGSILVDFLLHEPKEISLPNSDKFFIEQGFATLQSGSLVGIARAKAPFAISLPGEIEHKANEENAITLSYYESGDIRSLSTGDGSFRVQISSETTIDAYSVNYYLNGVIKQIYFDRQQIPVDGIGLVNAEEISLTEDGNMETVVLSAGQTFNYRIGGSQFLFAGAILFQEDGSFKGSRLAADNQVELPDENTVLLPRNSIVSFNDNGTILNFKGLSKELNITLPNSDVAVLSGKNNTEVEYYESGQVKKLIGLLEPYTITFPNGATATAYYMLEYDEQGSILSFY